MIRPGSIYRLADGRHVRVIRRTADSIVIRFSDGSVVALPIA